MNLPFSSCREATRKRNCLPDGDRPRSELADPGILGDRTSKGPTFAWFWNILGILLARAPERAADAETAYRKAIELDPQAAWFWNGFGILLAKTPEGTAEAEAAYRKAIELDPEVCLVLEKPWQSVSRRHPNELRTRKRPTARRSS